MTAPAKAPDRASNEVSGHALPLRPDIATTDEDPYSDVEIKNPAPDGRPWKKCCEECAFLDPAQRPVYLDVTRRTDTHFYCVHRSDDNQQRVCAGFAAFEAARLIREAHSPDA